MQDPTTMTEEHCGCDLVQIASNQFRVHHSFSRQRIHVFLQIHRQEFENQIQAIILHQNIHQGNNVCMLQLFQQGDFARKNHNVFDEHDTEEEKLTELQSTEFLRLRSQVESFS